MPKLPNMEGIMPSSPYCEAESEFASDLLQVLKSINLMLLEKNRKYGDAALNPNQTFSRVPPIELINVRMDDKLSRIRNRQNDEDEDVEVDLIGYLILKQIAKTRLMRTQRENQSSET